MYRSSLVFILSFLALSACNPDKSKRVDQTTISFETNDASKLFFKNLRQTYYDKEEMVAAKLDVYRLKKRNIDNQRPVINLAIVNNWRYDEAYLLLEPNSLLQLNELSVNWTNKKTGEQGTVTFENGNKRSIVRFADQLYELIQQESKLTVIIDGKSVDIINNSKDSEAFRITMVDYYRLVQRL
ncbi:MAG: hypothetical protein Roseis2KO_25260 [Roseivirga sp.]